MSAPALVPLRRVRMAALAAVPLLAALVLATAEPASTVPVVLPVLLALATGAAAVAGVVAADRMLERRTPTVDEAGPALQAHGFLQLAIAEFPLLLAVAMAYVMGPPWVVAVGAAAALGALLVGAPTTARARRLEAVWNLPADTLTHGPPRAEEAPEETSR